MMLEHSQRIPPTLHYKLKLNHSTFRVDFSAMYPFVVLSSLVSLLPSVLATASQSLMLAQIISPVNGTSLLPNDSFPFDYRAMGDLNSGVSSYTCTCWYFTGPVEGFEATPDFASGRLIGAFTLGNYSGTHVLIPLTPR